MLPRFLTSQIQSRNPGMRRGKKGLWQVLDILMYGGLLIIGGGLLVVCGFTFLNKDDKER